MTTSDTPRILQLCAVDFTAGHFLVPLMRAQRAAGFDVHFACAPGPRVAPIVAEGFVYHPIQFHRSYNLMAHAAAYRQLKALFRRERFEIVHTHTPIASLIARPAARRAGVPLVLYTAHGFYFHDDMKPLVRRAHIALERRAQRHADFLFTQSGEDLAAALAERIAPSGRALAIGNGVDMDRFDPAAVSTAERAAARAELGLTDADGPIIVMIGRLVREKGYFEFVEALGLLRERFPAMRTVVIGDALPSDHDDSAARIRARAAELGLGATVIFAGLRHDVPRLLAIADIYCLPSWREGMPRSIIEAMAMALPVVATDIRGCREEVLDGQTGRLVPVHNPSALAAALGDLLADHSKRRAMGKAGRARALAEYDERVVIGRQIEKMRQLMKEKALDWPK